MNELDIFSAALEVQSPEQRARYLDEACGDDRELRRRIDELLGAHAHAGSFMGDLASSRVPQPTIVEPIREAPGTVIGQYKLIEQIGEGGMGTVWMAQQTEPVKRVVALKLIKVGMDSKQVIARFEAERQALALMDHPNIAKVLDGGATSAGRLYFVMDLVKGVPITKYCDDHQLTPRQRLELFIPVCQAVQHAHQKGIIHRDIKPSNVLVALYDGKPVPKVIDFGVAKAAGQPLTEKTLVTGFGAIVGTLEYMSPEQADLNQLDIDTRSDIYSLGVLLYELLTGSPPFSRKELENAGMLEMLRVIREEEPSKPSTKLSTAEGLPTLAANRGTEPAKLTKLVRGELDWIVMRALDKDRSRRYETANGFAIDVQRYLADEPVLACPPSAWYRFRKFARRNRRTLAMGTFAALMLLVVVGAIAVSVGWVAGDRAAQQAALEKEAAGALDDVEAWHGRGNLLEARAALHRAEGLLSRAAVASELQQRAEQWRKDLNLVAKLDEIRLERSRSPEIHFDWLGADEALAKAFQEHDLDVRALSAAEAARRIQASAIKTQLIAALDDWILTKGSVVLVGGDPKEAAVGWKRLVAVARLADDDPWRNRFRAALESGDLKAVAELTDDPGTLTQPPPTMHLLALALIRRDDKARVVEILRQTQRRHPDDFWINTYLAEALLQLKQPSAAAEAAGFMRAALSLRPKDANLYINLGVALRDAGKVAEAQAAYHDALRLKPNYASAHNNLGAIFEDQGKLDEAEAEFRKAIASRPNWSLSHFNLGKVLHRQDRLNEAEQAYRTGLELSPKWAALWQNLGSVLGRQGREVESEAATRKAIEYGLKTAKVYTNLGSALHEQGKHQEAESEIRKAIDLDRDYADAYYALGLTLSGQGKHQDAEAEFHKALALKKEDAKVYRNLAVALAKQGKFGDAEAAFANAIRLAPKSSDPVHAYGLALMDQAKYAQAEAQFLKATKLSPKSALAHCELGRALAEQNKHAEAERAYQTAIELNPDFAEAYSNLGAVLSKQHKQKEAEKALRAAIQCRPTFAEGHYNLGRVLADQKQLAEAADAYRAAIAHRPQFANAYFNLGTVLTQMGKLADAEVELRKFTDLRPNVLDGHFYLGKLYDAKKDYDRAVSSYRRAIELEPHSAESHCNLGHALRRQGKFQEALKSLAHGHALGSKNASWTYPSARWVKECERLIDFEAKLARVKQGKLLPGEQVLEGRLTTDDPLDRIQKQSPHQVHNVSLEAGKLYRIDLASPDFDTFLRLEDSKGNNLTVNDNIDALDHHSRLDLLVTRSEKTSRVIVTSRRTEQTGRYFLAVQELFPAGKPQVTEGELTKDSDQQAGRYCCTHRLKATAGEVYLIDLKSTDFDPVLIVKDAKGTVLAMNDDGGDGLNSRVLFAPSRSEDIELVAVALSAGMMGAYTLQVQRHEAPNENKIEKGK